jgi:hypothetical protein
VMYVMPNSTVSDTTWESTQSDFSHSLLNFCKFHPSMLAILGARFAPSRSGALGLAERQWRDRALSSPTVDERRVYHRPQMAWR